MTPNQILGHLYALRAQIDAVIVCAEADVVLSGPTQREPGSCPECGASEDKIEDTSTLDGTKRNRCSSCGHEWERFSVEGVL